jgi:hypothetical protein
MREIANLSARAAVASHTTRKWRRSFAITLPLSIGAFLLAGTTYFLEGSENRFRSLAFSATMIGAVAAIEIVRSWLKFRQTESNGSPATSRVDQEGVAACDKIADRNLPHAAGPEPTGDFPESVSLVADEEPADSATVG